MKRILVTGSAGFIGFHLSQSLLEDGHDVLGFDGLTPYYDVDLKKRRNAILTGYPRYTFRRGMLQDADMVLELFEQFRPDVVVHLAAQAGVRHSIENPGDYVSANVVGTHHVLDAARSYGVGHVLMASTSSVYGAAKSLPFQETMRDDTPLTMYAATKKACESMAHSYANIYGLPVTMFRFFSIYGTWGRPDMALFMFVQRILAGEPINVYNHGRMKRDFTYISDLVQAIRLLMNASPADADRTTAWDSISPVAPYRLVNIGNSKQIELMDFIKAIEGAVGRKAQFNFMPMQQGDVAETWADTSVLQKLTGFLPETDYRDGVAAFVDWYLTHYHSETELRWSA